MRCIMVVEDCFNLDGKGLVVVGNQVTQSLPLVSSAIEVRRSNRKPLSTTVVDTGVFTSPIDFSKPRAFSILLPANFRVEDAPPGTEIWQPAAVS